MPYFYHLKFELYSTPDPTIAVPQQADRPGIWLPPPGTSVFDELPSHARSECSVAATTDNLSNSHLDNCKATPTRTPLGTLADSVIDCGAPRGQAGSSDRHPQVISERQWLERANSYPPPPSSAALCPQTATKDWRFGRVSLEAIDPAMSVGGGMMVGESSRAGPSAAAPNLGPSYGGAGTATKADVVSLESKITEVGWGIVHFYREGEETASLGEKDHGEEQQTAGTVDDCTTLCIPAVPAYMSPSDFLGYVGDGWRDELSHCRLVMTSKMNRYLALLKFRESKVAKKWKREFDGKVFNSMEPQLCHVVFVKSITFETPKQPRRADSAATLQSPSSAVSNTLRPFPPPTPNLVELPTCPVCLERMDETNGLMTIPCSHVFHCTCLQNWKGAGCPVCRFTNTSESERSLDDPDSPYSKPFGSSVSNLCSVCDCTDDLWICLICGCVGCGRYKGGHAKDHWKDTAHSFALELETQHVWDYAGDMWVHRLIRDKGDGKVVELPGRNNQSSHQTHDEDVVSRAKLENIGLEYTHLITSQLESQRAYYEEMINKAVDKAARASAAAESTAAQSSAVTEKLNDLEERFKALTKETIPQLERDLERERNRATKSEALARSMGKSLQEEKRVNEGLMKRIEHLDSDNEAVKKAMEELKSENLDLKEANRDLSMFISGQEKLKELESEGKIEEGELEGGSASVPEKKGRRRKR
ncbi:hypothetical protein QQS21_010895 [Conoideocrella luteorostrata]|uniref:Zf-UBP-domain-containing protein n=1 Tax=Conoideocrella luteorostrata TaxID=1105319 RepID=A0AAJ0CE44_9HYPO|nr:hypothetical protein QQS21_010895 [Conoideocrella luteorostrata]